MNSLLRTVQGKEFDKNYRIKKAITTQLSEVVKEIQLCSVEENILSDSLDVEEAANSLCCVVEAIFLHGLKDSLAHKFRKILKCTQLPTEVGQCRAWIRLAMNDCLLSSYFMTLRQNSGVLKSYYNSHAYVRDNDLLEVAQKLIEGVETIKPFNLPCFSSILNNWPQSTLILAGIWSPTLRTCPVQSCVDVAQSTSSNLNSETASLGSMISLHSRSSGIGNMVAFNEDEAFKIVLNKQLGQESSNNQDAEVDVTTIDKNIKNENDTNNDENNQQELIEDIEIENEIFPEPEIPKATVGNSLFRQTGWSFDENAQDKTPPKNVPTTSSLEHSYNALIESYNMFGAAYIKTPDIRGVWEHFEKKGCTTAGLEKNKIDSSQMNTIESPGEEKLRLLHQLTEMPVEQGLDYQNYECASCNVALSIGKLNTDSNVANLCHFSGTYYCNNCMHIDMVPIPARMIHNWDHQEYRVSRDAFNYIQEIKDHPYIDLKTINPYIYGVIEEMSRLQVLRNQLNFLRAYLYTCRDPIIEEFQKMMWPREYMYEHVHQYSVLDLQEIPDGTLAGKLREVVDFAKKHVMECWLCSHKGFLCEICDSTKVLFPFDVENVYRCEGCSAVYHKGCLDESKPCPKCKRQRERADMSLLAMTDD
ncbi:uncharacterized protein [Onthophagus taurus]|uniref:uncharacterized protein isoform X2 n=1 Tax=Onthophagus taurus TaxID=166361 RepID=UPI000C207992|nr:uncharacterized protein LOC111425431 isoform X2 [Onthophagus taurus]